MEGDPRMTLEPGSDVGRLVGGHVVEDEVELACGVVPLDVAEEGEEVGPGVASSGFGRHLAGRDLERGEQARRPVALVVMGVALDLPGLHRQHRLGPIERLDLGLLVEAEDDRSLGRVEVQPDHVADLRHEVGISAELERLGPVGGGATVRQIRQTVVSLIVTRFAIRRALQWVGPSDGGPRARAMTQSRSSRLYVGGCPGRASSASPAMPERAYRPRQSLTVMVATPSSVAIRRFGVPSAARRTILARWTSRCSVVRARTSARRISRSELVDRQGRRGVVSHVEDRSCDRHNRLAISARHSQSGRGTPPSMRGCRACSPSSPPRGPTAACPGPCSLGARRRPCP